MKEQLLRTAAQLKAPSKEVAAEYVQKSDQLAAMVNRTMSERPDLDRMIGEGNQQIAEDQNRYFARFMGSMFSSYHSEVMVEPILWIFRAYRSHGFKTTYWPANLITWLDTIRRNLSKQAFRALSPFYDWLIINVPLFTKLTETNISDPLSIELIWIIVLDQDTEPDKYLHELLQAAEVRMKEE